MKKYKIIKTNEYCILLKNSEYDTFKVMDIENDCIAIGSYAHCKARFDTYDLEEVRKEKRAMLDKWLEENAEE